MPARMPVKNRPWIRRFLAVAGVCAALLLVPALPAHAQCSGGGGGGSSGGGGGGGGGRGGGGGGSGGGASSSVSSAAAAMQMVQQYRVMTEQSQQAQMLYAMRAMQMQAEMQRVQQQQYERKRAARYAWAEERRQKLGIPSGRKNRPQGMDEMPREERRESPQPGTRSTAGPRTRSRNA